jgi:hypothetical protein
MIRLFSFTRWFFPTCGFSGSRRCILIFVCGNLYRIILVLRLLCFLFIITYGNRRIIFIFLYGDLYVSCINRLGIRWATSLWTRTRLQIMGDYVRFISVVLIFAFLRSLIARARWTYLRTIDIGKFY